MGMELGSERANIVEDASDYASHAWKNTHHYCSNQRLQCSLYPPRQRTNHKASNNPQVLLLVFPPSRYTSSEPP
jgi:hypothetical protein